MEGGNSESLEELYDEINKLEIELQKTVLEFEITKKQLSEEQEKNKKSEKYNGDLRLEIEKLNCLLRLFKSANHSYEEQVDAETQVDEHILAEDLTYYYAHDSTQNDSEATGSGSNNGAGTIAPWQASLDQRNEAPEEDGEVKDGPLSIADSLKEAAESAMQQSGYVYDENTGLYYDHKSGYYYDSEKQLYYEPNHGTYYYYDPETSSYLFHSQVDLSQYGSNYPSPYPQPPVQVGQAPRTSADGNSRKEEQEEEGDRKRRHRHKKSRRHSHKNSTDDLHMEIDQQPQHESKKHHHRKKKRKRSRSRHGITSENNEESVGRSKKKKHSKQPKVNDDVKIYIAKPSLISKELNSRRVIFPKPSNNGDSNARQISKKNVLQPEESNIIDGEEVVEDIGDVKNSVISVECDSTTADTYITDSKTITTDADVGSSYEHQTVNETENGEVDCTNNSTIGPNMDAYMEFIKKQREGELEEMSPKESDVCLDVVCKKEEDGIDIQSDDNAVNVEITTDETSHGEIENDLTLQPEMDVESAQEESEIDKSNESIDNLIDSVFASAFGSTQDKNRSSPQSNTRKEDASNLLISVDIGFDKSNKTEDSVKEDSLKLSSSKINNEDKPKVNINIKKQDETLNKGENSMASDPETVLSVDEDEQENYIIMDQVGETSETSATEAEESCNSLEDGEISDSESEVEEIKPDVSQEIKSSIASTVEIYSSFSSSSDSETEEEITYDEDELFGFPANSATHWPPCIRVMVKESDCLDKGTLYILTCSGATIGREKTLGHDIVIPDEQVSKMHCDIMYNEDMRKYLIKDHASQNGTLLNAQRLCKAKSMSDYFALEHMDSLEMGGTQFELHIHQGTETCAGCEPGQVQADIMAAKKQDVVVVSQVEKEKLRKKELKQIKRKYGLENMSYVQNQGAATHTNYTDKASERRKKVGSDNPYQKDDAPSSVHVAISSENKGHKLLSKMGWKEGESLGKTIEGIKEPIQAELRPLQSAGLGSSLSMGVSLDNTHNVKKSQNWLKTKQRFQEIENKSVDTDTSVMSETLSVMEGSASGKGVSSQRVPTRKGQKLWVKGETIETDDNNS